MVEVLKLMPGIANFAPAISCKPEFKDIVASAIQIVKNQKTLSTFKIETRRSYKQFPMDSMEVSRDVGGEVLEALMENKVDIKNPALVIKVEIDKDVVLFV